MRPYLQAVRRSFLQAPQLLTAHLLFAALRYLLLWPAFALLYRAAVRLSGKAALADFEIAAFLTSPVGFLSLVGLAGLLITIIVFEIAAMMAIDVAERRGAPIGSLPVLRFILGRAPAILRFSLHLVGRIALIVLPALALMAAVAWFLLGEHDINYYLAERPLAFWAAAIPIGAIGLATGLLLALRFIRWIFALPLSLFGSMAPVAAFRRSGALVGARYREAFGAFAAWVGGSFALQAATAGVLYALAASLVPRAAGSLALLAIAIGAALLLAALVQAVLQAFFSATLGLTAVTLLIDSDPEWLPQAAGPSHRAGGRDHPAGWALAALGLLAGALALGPLLLGETVADTDVAIIAHRAGAGGAPENTMAAVRQAITDQADWIEIDVQEIADGTVIVTHDRDFMRQARNPLEVHRATQADLAGIDLGSWFAPRFAAERVPTLDALLREARGRVKVLIELKYYGHDRRLEESVARSVEGAGMADAIAVMSLDQAGIDRMRALRPDWPRGIVVARAVGDLSQLDATFLAVNVDIAGPGLIRRAHAAGREVYVWTINDPAQMSDFIERGVDGLITDAPAAARRVLAERAALGPPARLMLRVASRLGLTGRATGR